jgi:hypothetical protein
MDNPHERWAREVKTAKLVAKIDSICAEAGLHYDSAFEIANMLRGWPAFRWAELAISCGVRPPSETTQREVIARIQRRGMRRTG